MICVFLDDDRNYPIGEHWTVVRTIEDMLDLIDRKDAEIEEISFDNDLRQPLEGIHGLNAIRERLLDNPGRLRNLKRITVHSMNGDAVRAILSDLHLYVKHGLLPDIEIRRRAAEGSLYPLANEDDRNIIPYQRSNS